MNPVNFDVDVLRSFSTGVALGSFARAADKLGRSTSAISAQLKKLEGQAGTPLFRRAGRGLELTDAGETMLAYAHRLLEINDEAAAAMRGVDLAGWVRLGLQEDLGENVLPGVLGRFARAHPKVRVEACVARSAELQERLELGALDLALMWEADGSLSRAHGERLARLPLHWIGPAAAESLDTSWWADQQRGGSVRRDKEALPLVLLDAPCPLRDIVTTALDRAGIAWRHAFTSASLAALWAATSAGLGLSVRTRVGLPPHVRALDRTGTRLPALPALALAMYRLQAQPEPPVARLAELLREGMAASMRDAQP